MKTAIDAHALGRGQAGYESYLRHLTAALPRVSPEDEFLLYRDLSPHRLQRLFRQLPARLKRDRPDVIHVQYAAPIPCQVPLVATVHDLSFEDVPHFFPLAERLLLQAAVRRTVRLARRVITVSEFSRARLISVYGLPEEKIVLAPNAAGPEFRPRSGPRAALSPYILMVGDLQPRKNHVRVIQAFSALNGLRLLIAGRETSYGARIRAEAASSGAGHRIEFLGYVADEKLPGLYQDAELLVYPSLYEGFGLPVIEAMACGTPVVTSRTTALREVADGAAVLADPEDVRDLRAAMEAALKRSTRLRAAGLARAARFSWQKSALVTVNAYRAAAGCLYGKLTPANRATVRL